MNTFGSLLELLPGLHPESGYNACLASSVYYHYTEKLPENQVETAIEQTGLRFGSPGLQDFANTQHKVNTTRGIIVCRERLSRMINTWTEKQPSVFIGS